MVKPLICVVVIHCCSSLHSGPGPGEEFEEHEGFEVLWAQKMLAADGQEQEISMLLLGWLHIDFEEYQLTSDRCYTTICACTNH